MILGMRFFQRVWLIMHLLSLLMTDTGMARIRRAGTGSRLVSATTASAEPWLSTELLTALQDPPGAATATSSSSSHSSVAGYSINLIIPVEGVLPDDLRDSFDATRSGGRLHHAIDIIAPRGT